MIIFDRNIRKLQVLNNMSIPKLKIVPILKEFKLRPKKTKQIEKTRRQEK